MRKRFVCVTLTAVGALALMTLPLRAQVPNGSVELLVGTGRASLGGYEPGFGEQKPLQSITVGAAYSLPLAGILSGRAELLYSLKGEGQWFRGYDAGGYAHRYTGYTAIPYLELPFLFQVTLPTAGSLTPALMAGPVLSIKLGCRYRDEYSITFPGEETTSQNIGGSCSDDEYAARLSTVDLGWMLGAGIRYHMISLQTRYNIGLTNMVADVAGPVVRNRMITLVAGVTLPAGKN